MKRNIEHLLTYYLVGVILAACFNLSFAGTVSQSTAESYYHQGNQYLDQGMYELAIPEYQAAIQVDPKYRPAYRKLGDAYRYLKNYTSAIDNYLKFVNLSTDTADAEGKQLLLDVAKLCDEINDSENTLRTLEGLLQYYYPESLDKVETIVKKYQKNYLLSIQTTKFTNQFYREPDPCLQQAIFLKGKLLIKLGRKHKAYNAYSQYYTLSRYRDKVFIAFDAPAEWYRLYFENMEKPVPEEWQQCPWVIKLSPKNPEYKTTENDDKIFEDTAGIGYMSKDFINPCYIVQAKTGYKIKRLEFTAEVETHNFFAESSDTNIDYAYPFVYDYTPNSAGSAEFAPKVWLKQLSKENPTLPKYSRQWAQGALDFKNGVRATRFWILSSSAGFRCHQWRMKAEFIPESGDTTTTIRDFVGTTPMIIISTHPWAKTKVVIDNKQKISLNIKPPTGFNTYQWDTSLATAGWHSYTAERAGLPIKQKQFYWNGKTDYILDIGYDVEWDQISTNLVLPPNISEMGIIQDNNQKYHLLVVASSEGQTDIYQASSPDLITWSTVNKLPINNWENEDRPRLIQDLGSGMFYLVWNRNKSIWFATSLDSENWSRPIFLFPFGSYPLTSSLAIYQNNNGTFALYMDQWIRKSDDGITWSKGKRPEVFRQIGNRLIQYLQLPDRQYLAVLNDYANKKDKIVFYLGDNADNFREIGTLDFKDQPFNWMKFTQILDLGNGKYGFILDAGTNRRRCFSTSPDLVYWTEPIEIACSTGVISNMIRDTSGRFSFLRPNGDLWVTTDLK
ncbi:MAG: tetratricopeptide repeat protein [bacterium]